MGLPLVLLGLVFAGGLTSKAAGATFEIAPEGFSAKLLDAEGNPEHLAGSHPDLKIDFTLNLEESTPRDLIFELPPGLGINAAAVPRCPAEVLEAEEECPPQSRVGGLETVLSGGAKTKLSLFAMDSAAGQPLKIATEVSFGPPVTGELRPGDFGVTVKTEDIPSSPIVKGHLELWGVPADHQEGAGAPRRALLSAPSSCGPLTFGFKTRSWEEEASWQSASIETEPLTGCESLRFEPHLGLQLSNPEVDAPTGMRTELSMPEEGDPNERAQAQIKNVTVEMPAGIALSPGGAATLSTCSDAQLGLGNDAEAHCPQSSKVGSVELASPAIEGAISGTIYLGEERPGQRFRVFVVATAAGAAIKSVGALQVMPGTGRLSTVLEGLPPLSISRLAMVFDGGPGAMLATPLTCGAVGAAAKFTPYGGGPPVEASAAAMVSTGPDGLPCSGPPPFSPQLLTSVSSRKAGQATTFSSVLLRRRGEQVPSRFSITLPAGLSSSMASIQLCSAAAAAAAACPEDSRVGSVIARVGSEPSIATLRGSLYFTGPYRGAPFGMLLKLPAVLGPFDLGSISSRGAAELDPVTGRFTMSMDRLPGSLEGVPVRFQSMEMKMDRPGFIRNPTSCAPSSTEGLLEAEGGATATVTSAFRVRGCQKLGFKPSIRMALVGRRELHKHGKPGMRVNLRLPAHGANLRAMRLFLPRAFDFSVGGMSEICSRRDAIAGNCPPGSRVGGVRAKTSLLKEPLSGSTYVAQPPGDGLPDVWTHISGGGLEMNMRGKTAIRDGHMVIELAGMPDVPISSFTMWLGQGSHGTILLGARPCLGGEPRSFEATAAIDGQNGARRTFRVPIGIKARCSPGRE